MGLSVLRGQSVANDAQASGASELDLGLCFGLELAHGSPTLVDRRPHGGGGFAGASANCSADVWRDVSIDASVDGALDPEGRTEPGAEPCSNPDCSLEHVGSLRQRPGQPARSSRASDPLRNILAARLVPFTTAAVLMTGLATAP